MIDLTMRRPIPGTQLTVSPLCLGTMNFGTPVALEEATRIIEHARVIGINFIDTANMYEGYSRRPGSAGGAAEEIIGTAVLGRRDDFIIATKVGMEVGPDGADNYTSPAAIHTQLQRSLDRLRTDRVEIYFLHRYDPNTAPEDICSALGEEMAAGRICTYGVSNYTGIQLSELVRAARKCGVKPPAVCQPRLSLIDTAALADVIPICVAEGIAVMPYQVLEGGLLTGKYLRLRPAGSRGANMPSWLTGLDDADVMAQVSLLEDQAAQQGLSLAQFSVEWALAQKSVISAVVGASRENQLDEFGTASDGPSNLHSVLEMLDPSHSG